MGWGAITVINPKNHPPEVRGWYTAAEVAAACNKPVHRVWGWIRRGLLTAARKNGRGTHLHITDRAFKRFLELHGAEALK